MANESEVVDGLGRKFSGNVELVDRIKNNNIDVAFTTWKPVIEKDRDSVDVSGGSEDDGAATTANTSVIYGDNGTKILVQTLEPIANALSIEAIDAGKEEKAKADKAKLAKEKEDRSE